MATKSFDVLVPSKVTVTVPDPVISEIIVPIVTPPNLAPTARAGVDQSLVIPSTANSINSTLNGTASTDPENKPLIYGWRIVSGPSTNNIATPATAVTAINNLIVGTYLIELRVSDGTLAGIDTMTITVTKAAPPVNQPPIASAGADVTITLPVNSVRLDGTLSRDPDGQIKAYKWSQVTDLPCTITNSDMGVCDVSDLKEGNYLFLLRVTDNNDSTTGDQVNVFVLKEVVTPPPATSYPFTFTKDTAYKKRIFAGFENWNGQNYAQFTGGWGDMYFRFVAADIVKGANGTYDWTRFDREFLKAASTGAGFSCAFFLVNDSDNFLASESIGGATARYCLKWDNEMMAESVKPFNRNGMRIPNWNSTSLLNNYQEMLRRVNERLDTQTFNGVKWKEYVNYIDIREYGQWGEWHAVNIVNNVSEYPAGTRPTVASYKRYIDSHTTAFPDVPLVCLFAAYDANWLGHTMTPPEVTDYVLKAQNQWGLIGWRRDQWGQTDNYINDYLQNNNRSFGSSGAFKNIIMERWKYAPIVGEPYGPGADLSDLKRQVEFYHATSLGNGNYPNTAAAQALFKAAVESAGSKFCFTKGKLDVSATFDFDISLTVENFGLSPFYDKRFNIVYELKDSTNKVVWTNTSTWQPALKLSGTYNVSDHYKLVGIPKGTYSLTAVIKNKFRAMPLFNKNQNTDGSMLLSSGIKF